VRIVGHALVEICSPTPKELTMFENPDDKKKFEKAMRAFQSRMVQKQDQELAALRQYWEQWDVKTKTEFKDWINKIADLKRDMPRVFPHLTIKVEFIEQVGDDDFERIKPSIEGMRRAVDCWERGDDYDPNTLGELL
jgi:hypothetical protein